MLAKIEFSNGASASTDSRTMNVLVPSNSVSVEFVPNFAYCKENTLYLVIDSTGNARATYFLF